MTREELLEWAKEKYKKAFKLHLKKGDRYHYGLGKMDAYRVLIKRLEDNDIEIRKKIQDAWMDFSAEYALKSEDGKFTMTDLREAFYKGIEVIDKYY